MQRLVAIVPLYNHAPCVVAVLEGIRAQGLRIIVVDDGSTDDGAAQVESWLRASASDGQLIRLERNRGKANALLAGFRAAAAEGATHAVTIDADGQHDPAFIPAFARRAAARGWDQVLVLGDRRPIPSSYPLGRLTGRMMSGLAVRSACGAHVGDAACGMRLYPLATALAIQCVSGRYAWEEEAIVRSVWRGAALDAVQIPAAYLDHSIAPSHYRFGRDWTEGTAVLVACVIVRVFNPAARWTRGGGAAPATADLAWPLTARGGVGGLYATLLAACACAVSAVLAAGCALAGTAIHGPAALTAGVACLAALAAARTRSPLLPAALGWAVGVWAPIAVPVLAVLTLPAVCTALISRLRGTDT